LAIIKALANALGVPTLCRLDLQMGATLNRNISASRVYNKFEQILESDCPMAFVKAKAKKNEQAQSPNYPLPFFVM